MRTIVLMFLISIPHAVFAQTVSENIVCNSENGLRAVVNLYENLYDFGTYELSVATIRRTGGCYYAELPAGTPVRRLDYYKASNGLIFSFFELGYERGRKLYTANAAYPARQFSLVINQDCVRQGLSPCNYLMASIRQERCRGVGSRFLPESARQRTAVVIVQSIKEYVWLPEWCEPDQIL
jgi:hypothetical protein